MDQVDFFKKQIKLEKQIVEAAHIAVKDLKNKMVKELIEGIATDSTKHASLLSALVATHEGSNPLIDEKVTEQLKANLEEHIRLEQHAIDTYKELWKTLEDEKEKLIIKYILNDEIRHHALLKRIHKMIVEKETLTEQDLWDLTWQDSISHGSPGG
ncbi:MAG: ferritin-like domain-containing protein [Candidatus Heimdallarchaeota archaeon]|nr:ferritin-like domain-containing protein [Candidatus Heimdallarchaeota archaeon]